MFVVALYQEFCFKKSGFCSQSHLILCFPLLYFIRAYNSSYLEFAAHCSRHLTGPTVTTRTWILPSLILIFFRNSFFLFSLFLRSCQTVCYLIFATRFLLSFHKSCRNKIYLPFDYVPPLNNHIIDLISFFSRYLCVCAIRGIYFPISQSFDGDVTPKFGNRFAH